MAWHLQQNAISDPFDLGEFLQALPKRQFSQLWGGVKTITEEWAERAIEGLQEGGEVGEEIETEEDRQVCLLWDRVNKREVGMLEGCRDIYAS